MTTGKFAVFGVLLATAVGVAVTTVVAQPGPDDRTREMVERGKLRGMILDRGGVHIGVTVDDLNEEELKAAAGAPSGVSIERIEPDSPAAKAGLRERDIVVEIDGERVRSVRQFSRLIQETPVGRSVRLSIVRDGQRQTVVITPEARALRFAPFDDQVARDFGRSLRDIEPRLRELEPRLREFEPWLKELEPRLREFRFDGPFDFNFEMPRLMSPRGRLGVQLNELTPQLAEYFGVKDGGVLVASVTQDSPAEKAGLKAGDVITSIDGDRVRRTADLFDELTDKEGEVTVGILRDKKESTVKATLEAETRRGGLRRPA